MPRKREIFRKLAEQEPTLELAAEAITELREKFDPELLVAIEEKFGCTLAELHQRLSGVNPADPVSEWHTSCNWLATYITVTSATEAPRIFHLFSALAVASAAFGSGCFIDLGHSKVYPPIPVILLGPSGTRKSSAIGLAARLLKYLEQDGSISIIRDRFTIEGLVDVVRSGSKVMLLSSELSATLGKAKYLEGLIPVLTRLLDQEGFETTTRTYGITRVSDVAFGFLGASTTDWMLSEIPASALTGGFLGRFLLAPSAETIRVVYRTQPMDHALESLAKELAKLVAKLHGAVVFSPAADSYLESWYKAYRVSMDESLPIANTYHSRKLVHVVRLAMVLTLLNGRRVISEQEVKESIELLDIVEPRMIGVLAELSGNMVFRDMAQAIRIIGRRKFSLPLLAQLLIPVLGRKRYSEMLLSGLEMGVLRQPSKSVIAVDYSKITPQLRRVLTYELEEIQAYEQQDDSEAPAS